MTVRIGTLGLSKWTRKPLENSLLRLKRVLKLKKKIIQKMRKRWIWCNNTIWSWPTKSSWQLGKSTFKLKKPRISSNIKLWSFCQKTSSLSGYAAAWRWRTRLISRGKICLCHRGSTGSKDFGSKRGSSIISSVWSNRLTKAITTTIVTGKARRTLMLTLKISTTSKRLFGDGISSGKRILCLSFGVSLSILWQFTPSLLPHLCSSSRKTKTTWKDLKCL